MDVESKWRRLRILRKKLIQISNLELQSSTRTLNEEERIKVGKKEVLRVELSNLNNDPEIMKRKQNSDAAPDFKTSPTKVSKSSSSCGNSGRSSRSTGNPSEQEPDVSLTATVEPTGSSTAATLPTPDPASDNNPTDAVDTNNSGEDEIDGYVLLPTTTSLPSSSTVVTSSVPSSSQTFSGQQRSASGSQSSAKPPDKITETIKLWRKRSWTVDELEGHEDRILDCDVNIEHNMILTSSCDTTVKVWDLTTGALTHSLRGHTGPVTGARIIIWQPDVAATAAVAAGAVSPTKRNPEEPLPITDVGAELKNSKVAIISASIDCSLKTWKLEDCKAVNSIYTYNGINKLKVIQRYQYAVIGSEGGKLEMYDLYSGKQVYSQSMHQDAVTALSVCEKEDKIMLASGSEDGIIKVFEVLGDKLRCLYVSENVCAVNTDTSLHIRPVSSIFITETGVVYYGDTGHNMKMLDWKQNRVLKFANHTTDQGFTDAIDGTSEVLIATGYDVDADCGQMNIYRARTDQIPQYMATLADNQTDRITVMKVTESPSGTVCIVTAGYQLKIWRSERTLNRTGTRDNSTSIQGCVLSLGDSALIDSGTEDSDLEDRILDPDTTRPDLGSRLPIKQGAGFCNCSIS